MFTEENVYNNKVAISVYEKLITAAFDNVMEHIIESLQANNNSIQLSEDGRVVAGVDGDEIIIHGLVWDKKNKTVLCHYHLLNEPEYENTCDLTESDADVAEILQAINDAYENDPESM